MASITCNNSFADVQTKFLAPMYGVEFVVSMIGNSLAIWLLGPGGSKNPHAGIIFSLNLAVSDLFYSLSLPLLVAYYIMNKNWVFGSAICKVERFIFNCNLYGSIFFITCISANRCLGIVFPFYTRGRVKSKHAKLVSVGIWVLVASISAPVFFFSKLQGEHNNTECIGTAVHTELPSYFPYSLFLAGFGCALPFLITFLSYIGIAKAVWKSHGLEPREKRKVVTLVCVVVLLYTISFVPYHILRNLNLRNRMAPSDCKWSLKIHSAFQVAKALVSLNPCIHPLLYTAVIDNVRAKLGCYTESQDMKTQEETRLSTL
ncbi:purinergic receptor P2Y, G-protein coupled, 11 S homeolog [Xenopus laevis]|uniref:LOC100127246 protein n=2 Tax=Xenopus laevis TaxID=8355 RepID=A8WH39_XENLA|nr:purinergic receptor P2Y, G-protein coupled, 11 S homeolog [Xenopus laevis]AAI54962.1 LOC100127246 protein [Xenopus laevis]AAI69640.1 Hypothetical protein LOC100127246 [Xenopus laevis]AAI69642.1 Hypothetical protein LOC100127246 [Xenopus laevis]OCT87920.1 hypothetical protein XELAEV_18021623mg [Xenopus laevis]